MRFAILSFHTGNIGDEAALFGLIKEIASHIPNSKFVVLADNPSKIYTKFQGINVSFQKWILPPGTLMYKYLPRKYDPLIGILNIFIKLLTKNKNFIEVARLIYNSDVVLFSPGGPYFGTTYIPFPLIHLMHLAIAVILKKPICVCGVSMGPFNGIGYTFMHRLLLNRVQCVILRDEISKVLLNKLNLTKPRVIVTADSALLLNLSDSDDRCSCTLEKRNSGPLIGVSVPSHIPNYTKYNDYKKAMIYLLDKIILNLNANVVFFASDLDDLPLIEDIKTHLRNSLYIKVITPRVGAYCFEHLLSQMDFIIATRLHTFILASKNGVPGMVISYQEKFTGYMQLVGLSDYVVSIESINSMVIESIFWKAWVNRNELSSTIKKNVEYLRKCAKLNAIIPINLMKYLK